MSKKENEVTLKKIIAHCKEYGFIFGSSEIYDGLSAAYDYGPNGVLLKNNISEFWWKSMVQMNENIVGLDASIFMHPKTWKASGHINSFNDPLIDNKDSKKRYRADVLVEDHIAKIEQKLNKEVTKARKRFGKNFDETHFISTHPRVISYRKQIQSIEKRMKTIIAECNLESLKNLIIDLEISDPIPNFLKPKSISSFNCLNLRKKNS